MANRSTDSVDGSSTNLSPPVGGGVIVDIGTGDGRYVYRSARANPERFYIGIDPQRKPLEKVSERVHRKPAKDGLPNLLFVQAPVEGLPEELKHVADEIHIHFPWGSLLRSVVVGDEVALDGLRRIAAPNAWLEILIGLDENKDAREARRLQLPRLTEAYIRSAIRPRYARAGFAIEESGIRSERDWPHIESTWAKRLRGSSRRKLMFIVARAIR